MPASHHDPIEHADPPFSGEARQLVADARQASVRHQHAYVGTEHLMLALGQLTGDAAPLDAFAIDGQRARTVMEEIIRHGTAPVTDDFERPFTLRAKRAIASATESAHRLDRSHVGVADVLVGLMTDHGSVAAQVLANLGVTLERAEAYARENPNEV